MPCQEKAGSSYESQEWGAGLFKPAADISKGARVYTTLIRYVLNNFEEI